MEFKKISASIAFVLLLILCNPVNGKSPMNDSEIVKSAFSNVSGFNITYVCSNMSSCDTIENLQLPSRNLSGIVAWRTLSGLVHLRTLDLSNNSLCGGISEDVWTMPSLRKLNLAMNCFGGTLHFNWSKSGGPSKYSVLETLNLSRNRLELFESTLDLSGFRSLKVLDLSRNKIIGNKVFVQLFNLKNLTNVSLAGNSLNSIPLVSQNSNAIMHLDVSYNNLSGNISSLAKFTSLQYLDLSSNNLTGVFPTDFPSLKNLRFLNLSINNFTGSINAGSIKKFHISAFLHSGICNNTLKVPCDQSLASPSPSKLPTIVNRSPPPLYTFASHSSASHSPFHKKKATIAGVLSSGAVLMVVIAILLCFRRRRQRLKTQKWVVPKPPLTWKIDRSSTESGPFSFETESFTWVADIKDSNSVPVSIFEKPLLNLTFSDLLSATSHFSKESQLADGQHGPVYRAILPGEIHVAIKVMEEAKDLDTEEAEAKFVALGRLKHPNILPLLGYCIAGKEKLLLYEFMQNGDLHQWLHELPRGQPNTEDWSMDTWEQQTDGVPVSGERMGWITRHRIALGIARALAFLHHGSSPPIIHGGLSPFNVLLDEHFEPHMAQSGIRDLVKTTRRASFNLAYAAPESTMALNESAKGDVYSFGVVLLELVTGKRASGDRFPDGFKGDLVAWVRFLMKEKHGVSALDSRLANTGPVTQMLDILRIGYLCTAEVPSKRPTMQQVVGLLKDIQPDRGAS